MNGDAEWRHAILFIIASIAVFGIALRGRIPQDPAYHHLADRRTVLGVPNFADVISNAAFLLAGLAGLWSLLIARSAGTGGPAFLAYGAVFVGVICVSFGSAWYHLRPDNDTLVWDRLPMTIAFMSFVSIVISQHIDPGLGRRLLPVLIVIGLASVIYWHRTDDLRPYAIVQFLPMALVPLILILFPPLYSKPSFLWGMLVSYAVAKCFEMLDAPIYRAIGISGHTLKHLAAAAGVLFLVMALRDQDLNYPHVRTGNPAPSHPPVAR